MEGYWLGLITAGWLGILTSISPCPLATNITAISYIGKRVDRPRLVLTAGLLYTLGRMAAYFVLALLIIFSLASVPALSTFLQRYMNILLGPLLILAGMVLLEMVPVVFAGSGLSEKMQSRADRGGIWGAGLLGILFALSFCPVSAALFFGSLVPLAVSHGSPVLMPCLYGLGTALPVVFFSILLAFSAHRLSRAFNMLTRFEKWARRVTGAIFLLVGVWFCLRYIFEVV
jgi:cytochrome c-type biogenesis protein